MPLNAQQVDAQLDEGLSGVALLSSSCQAVIEAEIERVESTWWEALDRELGEAEKLVANWRRSGVLYFEGEVLGSVSSCASAFLQARSPIAKLFASLEESFDPTTKQELIEAFRALEQPVSGIATLVGRYLERLASFEKAMGAIQQRMQSTVSEVQRNEVEIEEHIKAINAQIATLEEQVKTDREAISKARSEETKGIVETIFGILLAPVTGGFSLVLAGIGVASIAEAESAVDGMESEIASFQQTIAGDQTTLTGDQKIVATLQSLTMGTGLVLGDIANIERALDSLRTSWTVFDGELEGTVKKLEDATNAASLVVSKAWYEAACEEWEAIAKHVGALTGLPVTTRRREVG